MTRLETRTDISPASKEVKQIFLWCDVTPFLLSTAIERSHSAGTKGARFFGG